VGRGFRIVVLAAACAGILSAARAAAVTPSIPRVEVLVQSDKDALYDHVKNDEQERALLKFIAERIVSQARPAFPCMEWVTAPAKGKLPNAKVTALLKKQQPGTFYSIDLAYSAVIDNSEVPLTTKPITFKPIRHRRKDFEGLKSFFGDAITAQFRDEDFRRHVNGDLVRWISIASRLRANKDHI
jgi:hypothetical protein